jgi:S-adenosylmethionine-diacylgycerolhomoserine-N-methlytransferase
MRVLEVACGTGRNLAKIGKAWPGVRLFGLDISAEMLKSAHATLGEDANLGQGDACTFDPQSLLGEAQFERIVLSYSLSMIPDWEAALDHAANLLADGGALHIVDFGDLEGLPRPLRSLLRAWLAKFHVEPRTAMAQTATRIAAARGLLLSSKRGPLGYYQLHVLRA